MTKEQYLKVIERIIESPRNNIQKIGMLKQAFELYIEENKEEAHWIPSKSYNCNNYDGLLNYVEGYECSACGRFENEKEPYCNCGCKMTEVK